MYQANPLLPQVHPPPLRCQQLVDIFIDQVRVKKNEPRINCIEKKAKVRPQHEIQCRRKYPYRQVAVGWVRSMTAIFRFVHSVYYLLFYRYYGQLRFYRFFFFFCSLFLLFSTHKRNIKKISLVKIRTLIICLR